MRLRALLTVLFLLTLVPPGQPASPPGRVVSQRLRRFPERLLALTFDDGPSDLTPRILDALAAHHAHATFFVLGAQARLYPNTVRREVAEGHAVGSHSYSHPESTTEAGAASELDRTEQILHTLTGRKPALFRPPYGLIRSNLARLALKRGYAVVLWTISGADTRPIDARVIADNIIHTPSPGDIALIHDGPGHRATAEAVPMILDELGRAGWRFVTVPELLSAWERWERDGR